MSRKVGTEEAYPGLLTVIIGILVTLAAADARNAWMTGLGLALVIAGAYTGRRRG